MRQRIYKQLNMVKVKPLSTSESEQLWQKIEQGQPRGRSWFSPILLLKQKPMFGIIVAILLVLSGSVATVQASDSARPGDFLFPLDRAVEEVQLALTSDKNKTKLKIKFAAERADEVKKVLAEIEIETQSSDSGDSGNQLSDEDIERTERVVKTALDFIADVKASLDDAGDDGLERSDLESILEKLEEDLSGLSGKFKFEFKSENKDEKIKFEIKSEDDGRIKIKFKSKSKDNGKFEFKYEDKDHDDEDEDKDHDDEDEDEDEDKDHDKKDKKIKICHLPDTVRKTLKISENALDAHLDHGDIRGKCSDDDDDEDDEDVDEDDDDDEDEDEDDDDKLTICHLPDSDNQTMEIDDDDLDTHLGHGDVSGACSDDDGGGGGGKDDDVNIQDDPGTANSSE